MGVEIGHSELVGNQEKVEGEFQSLGINQVVIGREEVDSKVEARVIQRRDIPLSIEVIQFCPGPESFSERLIGWSDSFDGTSGASVQDVYVGNFEELRRLEAERESSPALVIVDVRLPDGLRLHDENRRNFVGAVDSVVGPALVYINGQRASTDPHDTAKRNPEPWRVEAVLERILEGVGVTDQRSITRDLERNN